MPPYYDIYALSKERNQQTIENFLAHFSYREKIEARENQEIGGYSIVEPGKEISIPISTLTEVIDFGVAKPDHCFAFYISDHLKEGISNIILKFTADAKIIFGISVDEKTKDHNGHLINNYNYCIMIEKHIVLLTHATKTSIQFEYPPADNEEEFDQDIALWKNIRTAIN